MSLNFFNSNYWRQQREEQTIMVRNKDEVVIEKLKEAFHLIDIRVGFATNAVNKIYNESTHLNDLPDLESHLERVSAQTRIASELEQIANTIYRWLYNPHQRYKRISIQQATEICEASDQRIAGVGDLSIVVNRVEESMRANH